MGGYRIAYEKADLGYYPNYSFVLGDFDGDGRMEFASMGRRGDLLRIHDLDGRLLTERAMGNGGSWGTPIMAAADLDGDGRDELVVQDGPTVAVMDCEGGRLAEARVGGDARDAYGIAVPILGTARLGQAASPSVIACVAGGAIRAYDGSLRPIWELGGLRRDFGHEMHLADVDGDGLDELAVCTVDDINGDVGSGAVGELLIVD
ncbi:MAG: FG-GAP-like repeat-containing protein, partial [Oscillospiraceae bacterium]|nr:FG-GAP-like repeat-containing protein [Oscillospiraceae bacterium]